MTLRTTKIPGSDDIDITDGAQVRLQNALSAIGWLSRMPQRQDDENPATAGLLVGPSEWIGDDEYFPVSLFTMPDGPDNDGIVSILFYVPAEDMTDDELDDIMAISQDIATMAIQRLTLFPDDDEVNDDD